MKTLKKYIAITIWLFDLKQYEQLTQATDINALKTKLEKVIKENPDYGNTKMLIQITFLDPYALGGLKLKSPHIHSDDYVNIWKTAYTAEDRILFLFEKQDKQYIFKDFAVTQSIEDGQIPDLAVNYIKAQILKSENNDAAKIVYKGLNAVKNAYDRRFYKKLIESADKMVKEKKYYKGYAYTVYEYYSLKRETNTNILPYNFCNFYAKLPTENYAVIVSEPSHSAQSTLAAVLTQKGTGTYYITGDNPLTDKCDFPPKEEELYVKNNQGAFVKYLTTGYTEDNYVFAENNADAIRNAQAHIDKIIETPYVYAGWERKRINGSWSQSLIFDSTQYYCSQQYRVIYRRGMFAAEEQVYEENGLSIWPNFEYGQATWCNQFARDLTKAVYGDFIIGSISANELFDFFAKDDDFISLSPVKNKDENEIWQNYVDKGYSVFYSKKESGVSGHIETCFPNNTTGNKTQQRRHSEDYRYPDDNAPQPAGSDKNLFVGAGNTVGYKNQKEKWRNEATPFLYLGFLKLEIN
jgi:hypothetical protein